MDGESIERLMEIILQMKMNLVHVTETLQQQTYEVRHQLEMIFEDQKKGLDDCLRGIDDKIKECAAYVEDYKRLHCNLTSMRQRLVQLGAEPGGMPDVLPSGGVEEVVAWRLQALREQGKV
jgi:hypothetical protein